MSYPKLLFVANLSSLIHRRDKLSQTYFQNMYNPILVSITSFHPLATLLQFLDYALAHLSLAKLHVQKSSNPSWISP